MKIGVKCVQNLQNADDERLHAGGGVDVLGDDEADGDAHRRRHGHEHDVEHLREVGGHLPFWGNSVVFPGLILPDHTVTH